MKLKLNYNRIVFVSMAFFLIQLFWQCYDTLIPKILTDKFGMSQTLSGVFMALDNMLALFLLPLFGSISDKCKSRFGKRTPFIVIGTVLACVLFIFLSFADNWQLTNIEAVSGQDQIAVKSELYNAELGDITDKIHDMYVTEEEYLSIPVYTLDANGAETKTYTEEYKSFVVPARQAYAWQRTVANPAPMIVFVVLLLFTLISMSIFRSPAVALMPDVTPKPLRSKANAVVNMLGGLAGAMVLGMGIVFGTDANRNSLMSYTVFFSVVAGLMMIALLVFIFTVKEKKWAEESRMISEKYGITDEAKEEAARQGDRHLSASELRSLILLLLSVAFWYIGYNSVTSKYSVYAPQVLGVGFNTTLLIAMVVAFVAFVPVAILSSKLGRKKTILVGVGMLGVSFFVASFIRAGAPEWLMYLFFGIAGIGWAAINVNSFPMVVELATGSDVGRYTGLYYTASMAAQAVAPVLGGVFLDRIGMEAMFPFGFVAVAASFVTMFFVKHGDAKPTAQQVMDEAGDD